MWRDLYYIHRDEYLGEYRERRLNNKNEIMMEFYIRDIEDLNTYVDSVNSNHIGFVELKSVPMVRSDGSVGFDLGSSNRNSKYTAFLVGIHDVVTNLKSTYSQERAVLEKNMQDQSIARYIILFNVLLCIYVNTSFPFL
jgi:hypothetical protein